jgi:ribosomal protein S18 acetylase RimI-like enzyme
VSGEPRVWRAQARDTDDVARLLIAFRDWLDGDAPSEPAMHDSVSRLISERDTEFLLAAAAAAPSPAGVCQLRFRHSVWMSCEDCWLEDLFVEDTMRGRGLGRALVLAAFERAGERGARRIELDTNEDNLGALALYESLGFSATSKAHGPLQGRDVFLGRRL